MTQLPDRFLEDRALRDAARAVLTEDVEQLRETLSEQGIASRVSSGVTTTISARIRSGARDVMTEVRTQAGDRKGMIALLIGAIILWFGRSSIFEWFEDLLTDTEETQDSDLSAEPTVPAAEGDPA